MKIHRFTLCIITMFVLFVSIGCSNVAASPQPGEFEPSLPTNTLQLTNTPQATETALPTPTFTPQPAAKTEPSETPVSMPTQAFMTKLVKRLCPELQAPLGLFSNAGPVYDTSVDPAVLYVPYEVTELNQQPSAENCTLFMSPAPVGVPQFAGETLFWKSFDHEQEWSMVWKYDLNDSLVDNVFPQHPNLRQTRTNTTIGKSGLYDFVVAESGENLVWTYTDPHPYDEHTMGYVRSMYVSPTSGPIDQRPPVEVMNDFFPESPSGAGVLRPRKLSLDEEMVFFSLEPVGLGRTWPEPLGRFTSLFTIDISWVSTPELVFDCDREFWCISDFSEKQDLLVHILDSTVNIIELSSGDLVRELPAPESYPLVRQAMIGADGSIAFLALTIGEAGMGEPPEGAAIYILPPDYQAEPVLVLEDVGILNLIGWAGPGLLLVDGNNLEVNSAPGTTPAHLMLIDIETGLSQWLPHDASGFVSLVP